MRGQVDCARQCGARLAAQYFFYLDMTDGSDLRESKECMSLTLATLIASMMIGTEVIEVQLFADVKVGSEIHSGARWLASCLDVHDRPTCYVFNCPCSHDNAGKDKSVYLKNIQQGYVKNT